MCHQNFSSISRRLDGLTSCLLANIEAVVSLRLVARQKMYGPPCSCKGLDGSGGSSLHKYIRPLAIGCYCNQAMMRSARTVLEVPVRAPDPIFCPELTAALINSPVITIRASRSVAGAGFCPILTIVDCTQLDKITHTTRAKKSAQWTDFSAKSFQTFAHML